MTPSAIFTAALLLAGVASGFYIPDFPGADAGPGFISIPVSSLKNSPILQKRDDVEGTANLAIPNMEIGNYAIKSELQSS